MDRLKIILFLVMLAFAISSPAGAAVGGGYTACGLTGEYFANPKLAGPAAFIRQDNRLNFDWVSNLPIGGSNTPTFRSFPHENCSVRWTGKLVPRFSEKYTFTPAVNGGVRVWLNNSLIIDRWSQSSTFYNDIVLLLKHVGIHLQANDDPITSNPISLDAGTSYDFKVEYRQDTGAAKMILRWFSPSTPEEVIDPLSVNGFNLANCPGVLYADDVKYCMPEEYKGEICWFRVNDPNVDEAFSPGLPPSDLDAGFWPKKDFVLWINPFSIAAVTYKIQFSGKADVSSGLRWRSGYARTFTVDGKEYTPTLPSGVGYDPGSNTTTALMKAPASNPDDPPIYYVKFTNTQRDEKAPLNSGVTNLHIMRPKLTAPDAEPCQVGTIGFPVGKAILQNYVVWRAFDDGFADERTWLERTLPAMPSGSGSPPNRPSWYNKPCWEYLIMLANETGKDLYVSISPTADHDYYQKLANLIKYGSDGVNPYTSTSQWPASGPVYPPLNPNLRFYIEYSNEVWNFGFAQFGLARAACNDAIAKKTPDGLIVNYDGHGNDSFSRWQALQTVNISNAFRAVFGDTAMGDRVRVLLFDQYGMYGNQMGQFLDNYFNKTDPKSPYTGEPHPVSYYIWGGGGAIYYGSNHPVGMDPDAQFINGSFETPMLADGISQPNPPGSDWIFTGNAGICHNIARQQAVTAPALGSAAAPAQKGWVGFKFTVGPKPIYVYDIGRLAVSGNNNWHIVNIFKADGTGLLADNLNTRDAAADKYQWTRIIEQGWTRNLQIPLKLEANTAYYVMSQEDGADGDACYAQATGTAAPGITINCPATSRDAPFKPVEGSGQTLGPVNFTFTDIPQGELGFTCDAQDGSQFAFIGDTGTMSQTVNFSKTGIFSVGFYAAIKSPDLGSPVTISVDGVNCTPSGGDNSMWKASENPWLPGGFERRPDDLAIWWGSATFPITQVGKHEIQIKGTGKAGQYLFFDGMKILSADSIYGPDCSYFPSMGEANGQDPRGGLDAYINTLHNEINWTAAWGMKTMAYEGGWSVGGDFDQKPLHSYCKYGCPKTIEADARAIGVYTSGGGAMFCYFYPQWVEGDVVNATQYPLVQAVLKRNDLLPTEPDYGTLIPGNLVPGSSTVLSDNADTAGNLSAQGAWINWNLIAPATQTYRFTSNVTGQGGSYILLVDDRVAVASGSDEKNLTGTVKLTKGQHTVKIRNTGTAAICVKNIAVTMDGSLAAPTLSKVDFGDGKCTVNWTAVPSATGYIVYYGTVSGNYSSSIKVGSETSAIIPGLDNSGVYYFTVQASNANNRLSPCSDETRIAHRSTDPQVLIDFADQAVITGTPDYKKPTEVALQNYRFTAVRQNSSEKSILIVQGPESGWPSHVLNSTLWGNCHRIQRADLKPFDLYSLDLCWGSPITAVIIGYDPSGASFKKIVNFAPSKGSLALPVVLDWVHVANVDIEWFEKTDGGGGGRCGCITNVLFNRTGQK